LPLVPTPSRRRGSSPRRRPRPESPPLREGRGQRDELTSSLELVPQSATVSERDLTGYVRDLARALGWRRYHTWLAKHSPGGFPDEVLVRPPRLVFAELKSERGVLTLDQEGWLEALRQVAGGDVYVWRPPDMDEIARVLR